MKRFVIELDGVKNNYRTVAERAGDRRVYCVVKGNAYGMGNAKFVSALASCGADSFAAVTVDDALEIRRLLPQAVILLMTPVHDAATAQAVVDAGIEAAVEDFSGAALIREASGTKKHPVQLALDTGFGRYGILPRDIGAASDIAALSGIEIVGAFTHLSHASVPEEKHSLAQISLYFGLVKKLNEMGIKPENLHALCSSGMFRFSLEGFTAVRTGSALVGRIPSFIGKTGLAPIGMLEAEVTSVRRLEKGSYIGYSGVYRAKRDICCAVVGLGFADGLRVGKLEDDFRCGGIPRKLIRVIRETMSPPRITATINGKKAVCIGKIGMTAAAFDVTGTDVKPGDTARISVNPIYVSPLIERVYE